MTKEELLRRLRGLLEAQFEELLFRLRVRTEYLPPPTAPRLVRALNLIQYLENQDRLQELERAIAVVVAGDDARDLREAELEEWHRYLEVLQRQVCRIDIRGARSGTAFLVEQDLVLTAFTAVQQLLEGQVAPSEVSFRFDLWPEANGEVRTGIAYRLAERDWLVDQSPPDRLNFAVLRLSELPRGGERLGAVALRSGGRGHISLPEVERPCPPGATLFLVHHPGGGAIRLSMSCYAVKRVTPDGCRFAHAIETDGGSVGGPFFDTSGALVAIHEGNGRVGNRTSVAWNAILHRHKPAEWRAAR